MLQRPQVRQCKHLPERQIKALCSRVRDLLLEESNVHLVQSPVTICGDIHGQFWDVLEILRQGGEVPETSYIFMVGSSDRPIRKGRVSGVWIEERKLTKVGVGRFRRSGLLQSRDAELVIGVESTVCGDGVSLDE